MVAALALAGAAVSWIAGGWFYACSLRQFSPDRGNTWFAIVAWPFAIGRLRGEPASCADSLNKALVAFFTCMMIAVAAISAATNLARVSR
jgi:hypothetical protein